MPVVETTEDEVLNIDKVALMDKNKVKFILSPDETRLYNLLDLRNLSTNFGTKIDGQLLEVNTDRTRARYKIVTDKRGEETIDYKIRITATLEEKKILRSWIPGICIKSKRNSARNYPRR